MTVFATQTLFLAGVLFASLKPQVIKQRNGKGQKNNQCSCQQYENRQFGSCFQSI